MIQKLRKMNATEFVAAGEIIFGSRWRKPISEALQRSARLVYAYAHGQRNIPQEVAESVREMATLGPAAVVVRKSVLRIIPECSKHLAHQAARAAEQDLLSAGLLNKDVYSR